MPEDLPLEPDLIKVLASDTRREILRLLRERNMTVTELARELDLGKATVHEHLNKLTDAGLVRRKEDERLWVYYEVSPEGKRMLNPQRTRFYLIVAVSVLAGIAAILALALFLSTGGGGDPSHDLTGAPEATTQDGLAVQVPDTRLYAAGPTTLQATVENAPGGADQLQGYLVPASQADRLRQGDLSVSGIPLRTQPAASSGAAAMQEPADGESTEEATRSTGVQTLTFQIPSQLPPGEYVLFVRTADGRYVPTDPSQDNRERMPRVEVRDLGVDIQPTPWYQGISPAANVTVTSQGQPVDGRLSIEPIDKGPEATGLTVQLANGTGTFSPGVLDALPSGTYELAVLPTGEDTWQVPGQTWTLHRPQIALQPGHLLAQETRQVDVSVAPAIHEPATPVPLALNGTSLLDRSATDTGVSITLAPETPGTLQLAVGRLAERPIHVHPNLHATIEILDGPRWRLDVDHRDGRPAANVTVSLDGAGQGQTNATGQLEMALPEEGEHRLALETPAGHSRELGLRVDGWSASTLDPLLRLFPQAVETTDGTTRIHLDISTTHPASVPATLTAHLPDGRPVASRPVTVAPNATTQVVLDVPMDGTGVPSLALELDPLAPPDLTVDNRTSQAESTDDGTAAGGGGADAADSDGTGGVSETDDTATATVDLPAGTSEVAMEADQAFESSEPGLEPVGGLASETADGMAGDQAQEAQDATPVPGTVALLALLAVVAAVVARRR